MMNCYQNRIVYDGQNHLIIHFLVLYLDEQFPLNAYTTKQKRLLGQFSEWSSLGEILATAPEY